MIPEDSRSDPLIKWRKMDLISARDCAEFVTGLDVIIHLAHTYTPFTSNDNPLADAMANLLPTLTLLEAIRLNASKPHFIYASSSNVYGISNQRRPFDETDPCIPVSSYAIQKLAVEQYLRMWSNKSHLQATVLRIGNPYGTLLPAERRQGLIGTVIDEIRRGQPTIVYGDSGNVRDYIHLEDVCEIVEHCLMAPGSFSIFNVGTGIGCSVREILSIIEKYSGKRIIVQPEPLPDSTSLPPWVVLNHAKAATELGWKPKIAIHDGIKRMCADFL